VSPKVPDIPDIGDIGDIRDIGDIGDILPSQVVLDKPVVNIIFPNTKSNNEENNTGSSSSSKDTTQAASTLITLVAVSNEHHQLVAVYHPKSLPVECYVKGTRTMIEAKYKTHVFDSLKVNGVKMLNRNVPEEAVSFYECLLLIKEQRE
jgi:hypothetical protein